MPETTFKYFHAIETLSRRKAEVSAEIAKANQKMIELNHAIELLQREQLNPAQYVVLPSVCSICDGQGCSTCQAPFQLICVQCQSLVEHINSVGLCKDCAQLFQARDVLLPKPLPELVRCKDCGDTAAFLTDGRCSICSQNPRPAQS